MSNPITRHLVGFAGRLRFPQLFAITAGLFVLDLVIPDPVPFLDEIVLGLATLLLANWRKRKPSLHPQQDDVKH